MYRDTCHAICIAIQFATIAIPAILQHSCVFYLNVTDINCQSAKNYQCCMSSHPQQTAGSYSRLKSIKLCHMSVISNKWSYDLLVVTGPSSLDSSRRRVSTLVIVFLACDFRGPGTNLIGPWNDPIFPRTTMGLP